MDESPSSNISDKLFQHPLINNLLKSQNPDRQLQASSLVKRQDGSKSAGKSNKVKVKPRFRPSLAKQKAKRESISNSTDKRQSSLSEGRNNRKNKGRDRSADQNDSRTIKKKIGEPLLNQPNDHNAHT